MFTQEQQKENVNLRDDVRKALKSLNHGPQHILEKGVEFTSPRIEIVNIQPGDKLVVFADYPISKDAAQQITERVSKWAGAEHQVIVLSDGLRLGVLKQVASESDPPTMTIHNPHPRSV